MNTRNLALIPTQMSALISCVLLTTQDSRCSSQPDIALNCLQDGGKQYGITTGLLMCFMTELGPQGAEECLQQVWTVLLHKQPAVRHGIYKFCYVILQQLHPGNQHYTSSVFIHANTLSNTCQTSALLLASRLTRWHKVHLH